MEVANRIIIVGCPGSGKSTFARALGARTGLPLYHLDNIWWRAEGTHISREAFDARLASILEGERWIIDGDYSRTYEPRFAACDTVIFLDLDEEECLRGIRERIGKRRPDIPWVEDEPDPELEALVRSYRADNRPRLYGLLEQYADRRALIFRTRGQARAWLSGLSAPD